MSIDDVNNKLIMLNKALKVDVDLLKKLKENRILQGELTKEEKSTIVEIVSNDIDSIKQRVAMLSESPDDSVQALYELFR